MKKIVKGSSALTAVSIGEMLTRFIRTKCIALLLGTSGTGFLAQLLLFFEMLRVWGDLGSRRAVIKQIAEQRFQGKATYQYGEVVKTSFFLAIAASSVVGVLVAVFSPHISRLLYGTPSHYFFIIFLAALLPIASLCTVTASIVKGNLEYMAFCKYTLAAYAAVIILIPPVIYFFGVWGGVVTMGLFYLFPLIAYLILNARKHFLHFSEKLSIKNLKEQFSYGFLQIYQESLTHFVRIAIATVIIRSLGLSTMGIYQVVMTFTSIYMAIPIQAMSGYVFPLIAASKNNEEINLAINESMRYLMFVLVPIIVVIMVMPELFIRLFFSAEFTPAVPVLRLQLLSPLFILMSYSYMTALTAKGKLKCTYFIATLYPLLCLAITGFFFPKWQLMGVAGAFAFAGLVSCLLHFFFAQHYFGTRLLPKNKRLFIMTGLWVALAYIGTTFLRHPATQVFLVGFGAVWFMVSSKSHERQYLQDKFKQILGRGELV